MSNFRIKFTHSRSKYRGLHRQFLILTHNQIDHKPIYMKRPLFKKLIQKAYKTAKKSKDTYSEQSYSE